MKTTTAKEIIKEEPNMLIFTPIEGEASFVLQTLADWIHDRRISDVEALKVIEDDSEVNYEMVIADGLLVLFGEEEV